MCMIDGTNEENNVEAKGSPSTLPEFLIDALEDLEQGVTTQGGSDVPADPPSQEDGLTSGEEQKPQPSKNMERGDRRFAVKKKEVDDLRKQQFLQEQETTKLKQQLLEEQQKRESAEAKFRELNSSSAPDDYSFDFGLETDSQPKRTTPEKKMYTEEEVAARVQQLAKQQADDYAFANGIKNSLLNSVSEVAQRLPGALETVKSSVNQVLHDAALSEEIMLFLEAISDLPYSAEVVNAVRQSPDFYKLPAMQLIKMGNATSVELVRRRAEKSNSNKASVTSKTAGDDNKTSSAAASSGESELERYDRERKERNEALRKARGW